MSSPRKLSRLRSHPLLTQRKPPGPYHHAKETFPPACRSPILASPDLDDRHDLARPAGNAVSSTYSAICTLARLLVAMPVVTLRGLDMLHHLHRLHQLRPRPARDRQRPDRLRPLPAGPVTVSDSKRFAESLACPDPVRHMSVNGRLAEHAAVWCNYPAGRIERALGCGLLISSRRSLGHNRTQH
jgi:hypothetical protein